MMPPTAAAALAVATVICHLAVPSDAAVLLKSSAKKQRHQGLAFPLNATAERQAPQLPGNISKRDVLPTGAFAFHAQPSAPNNAPHLFVAVLTTRSTHVEKRNAIRNLWREVDGGSGHICARFVVCQAADAHQPGLQSEHTTYGDMLFLPCAEGYAQGLLTQKVIASLRAYRQAAGGKDPCLDRPLFMKMDDDTFVAGHRFREGLALATAEFGTDTMYAGVDLPGQPPSRDASSPWYEPLQTWPHANYPPAMYGGPGYILGRQLVHRIIDEGVADQHVLWNEDRAVGVWVNALQTRGQHVSWIRIPGTNGFEWDKPVKSGTWGNYPYTLHHHLSKACIYCLTNVDKSNDYNAVLDPCFAQ